MLHSYWLFDWEKLAYFCNILKTLNQKREKEKRKSPWGPEFLSFGQKKNRGKKKGRKGGKGRNIETEVANKEGGYHKEEGKMGN